MTTEKAIEKLDREYIKKRKLLFKKLTRNWKYCQHQGCDDCFQNNGLVPPGHPYAETNVWPRV